VDQEKLDTHRRRAGPQGGLGISELVRFVDHGARNLLFLGAPGLGADMRKLALEFSVDFDDGGSVVKDHFSVPSAGGSADTFFTSNHGSRVVSGGAYGRGVLYRGLGHVVNDKNDLVFNVLNGGRTAYSSS
jgi:hypothetical protein